MIAPRRHRAPAEGPETPWCILLVAVGLAVLIIAVVWATLTWLMDKGWA